jgi:hypothetical protein
VNNQEHVVDALKPLSFLKLKLTSALEIVKLEIEVRIFQHQSGLVILNLLLVTTVPAVVAEVNERFRVVTRLHFYLNLLT